jgi:hypothetical protein
MESSDHKEMLTKVISTLKSGNLLKPNFKFGSNVASELKSFLDI